MSSTVAVEDELAIGWTNAGCAGTEFQQNQEG